MTDDRTTLLVRGAKAGDADDLAGLIEHLSPLLLSQARFRLRGRLTGIEPEEVVQEVWARALPALPDTGERDGRQTPVVVRFLATTLLHIVNELMRSEIRARRAGGRSTGSVAGASALPAETVGIVSRAIRSERRDALLEVIEALEPGERELLVMRGIEQTDNKAVAELLGETPNAVSLRYNRLLERLRKQLRGTGLDEVG